MSDDAHAIDEPEAARSPARELALGDWDAVVAAFRALFDELGEITQDEDGITFSSLPPDVTTSLQIRRDGALVASMPLHGIEGRIERIRWNDAMTMVELLGDGISYTYRIPAELLRHR